MQIWYLQNITFFYSLGTFLVHMIYLLYYWHLVYKNKIFKIINEAHVVVSLMKQEFSVSKR
jgi:hypothetical protein